MKIKQNLPIGERLVLRIREIERRKTKGRLNGLCMISLATIVSRVGTQKEKEKEKKSRGPRSQCCT